MEDVRQHQMFQMSWVQGVGFGFRELGGVGMEGCEKKRSLLGGPKFSGAY